MPLIREAGGATLIDVLDRILDKGIVIDAWVRVSVMGIDLLTLEARIVIASFETYLVNADRLALRRLVAVPPSGGREQERQKRSETSNRPRTLAARAGS